MILILPYVLGIVEEDHHVILVDQCVTNILYVVQAFGQVYLNSY